MQSPIHALDREKPFSGRLRTVTKAWRKKGLQQEQAAMTGKRPTAGPLADLLARVGRQKDRDAFSRLFDHFAPRVKSYLRRLRADDTLAEELTQEVMLTVWRKAAQFDPGKAAPSTWVFTIARNRMIDRMRRKKPDLDPAEPALQPGTPADAEEEAMAGEAAEEVKDALRALPEEQRQVVELSFLQGMAHSEIAGTLNIPLGTVKSRMRLAFVKLRASLEKWQ